MLLLYRLACVIGWHNWWDANHEERVCLECGRLMSVRDQPKATASAYPAEQHIRSQQGA
jgi:hypothetical protein